MRGFDPSPEFIAEHQARVRKGRGLDNPQNLLQGDSEPKARAVRRGVMNA
jgi:hypothetical protein